MSKFLSLTTKVDHQLMITVAKEMSTAIDHTLQSSVIFLVCNLFLVFESFIQLLLVKRDILCFSIYYFTFISI